MLGRVGKAEGARKARKAKGQGILHGWQGWSQKSRNQSRV